MLGLEMLDVAIGIIFIYLLISLICSAINELIESFLKKRAKDLERGIRELLNDNPDTNDAAKRLSGITQLLYEHPLISGLYRGPYISKGKDLPSYIPARNFALALLELTISGKLEGPDTTPAPAVLSIQSLKDTAGKIQDQKIRQAL